MPSTPTVSMWPQNISVGPGCTAVEHADHVRPSGLDLLQRRRRCPSRACDRATAPAICAFAVRAGHQRRIDGVDRDELAQQRDARILGHGRPVLCLDGSEGTGRRDHRRLVGHRPGDRARSSRAAGVAVVLGARRADRLQQAVDDDPRGAAAAPRRSSMDVTVRGRRAAARRSRDRSLRPARHHGLQCRVRLLRHRRRDRRRT